MVKGCLRKYFLAFSHGGTQKPQQPWYYKGACLIYMVLILQTIRVQGGVMEYCTKEPKKKKKTDDI